MTTISVIGLGKLGTPMLAVFAGAGYGVVGFDTDEEKVAAINNGVVPKGIYEPGTQSLLDEHHARYSAVNSIAEAVTQSDVTFVIVPTPSGPDGGFTLEYLAPVCADIGAALVGKAAYHTISIVSTVMPGQTRDLCGIIEQASCKAHGVGFGLVYSPEFIALGSVVKDLQQPDYVLIGAEDALSQRIVGGIYEQVTHAPQVMTTWVNAEIAKIAQNAYITMKITFANQLGNLCQAIPGAHVDEVTRALGHDRRIGAHFLTAGAAYGGPCFPRDNRAIVQAGKQYRADFGELASIVDRLNFYAHDNIPDLVYDHDLEGQATVGILGLSYKNGTPVIEESAAIVAAQQLAPDYTVMVYDPLALDEARAVLGDSVQYAESAAACIDAADVVVLMSRDYGMVQNMLFRGKVLIDPWRVMAKYTFACKQYIPLGIGPVEIGSPLHIDFDGEVISGETREFPGGQA